VQRSIAQGAKLLVGGVRRQGRGYFFEPTVLTDGTPDMPASCEEVFGAVAALLKVRGAEEAIQVANASPYGLGANLWTADLAQARRWASDTEAGGSGPPAWCSPAAIARWSGVVS